MDKHNEMFVRLIELLDKAGFVIVSVGPSEKHYGYYDIQFGPLEPKEMPEK